jgi:flagellar hook-associated protein FlgK
MININPNTNTGSALQQGLNGLQNSTRATVEAANELVSAGTLQRTTSVVTDIVEPIIEINRQQQLFDASAKVVQAADQNIGTLFDALA